VKSIVYVNHRAPFRPLLKLKIKESAATNLNKMYPAITSEPLTQVGDIARKVP
jgi:hypothetical protein